MDTKVKDLISSSIGKIHELSDADTIIGDPIKIDGNITREYNEYRCEIVEKGINMYL